MNYAILMTACIQPKNLNRPLFRSNPEQRLNDYKKALWYWLNYEDKRITDIVFVENSGYDLKEIYETAKQFNKHNRNIEFLRFSETEREEGVHYGYSDMEIMDYAINNSRILANDLVVIKITGRLYFPRLSKLLDIQDRKCYDFFSDVRDFKAGKIEKHYLVTTLFLFRATFYKKYLYGVRQQLIERTESHMETLYFKILKPLRQTHNIRLGFPFLVDPKGIGAHSNSNYASLKRKIESIGFFILRKFLPSS